MTFGRHILFAAVIVAFCGSPARAGEISFRNDVMAVFSKAGCNAGVCHGNRHGKGGFKLSLRGQEPEHDYMVLTHGQSARRTNPMQPDRSLILLKPTMQVPHQGGKRFRIRSQEYRILHEWIAAGLTQDRPNTPRLTQLAVTISENVVRSLRERNFNSRSELTTLEVVTAPQDSVRLHAHATFSDGTTRDVTTLAVYETDNQLVAVDHDGLVHRQQMGEATVVVRFLDKQSAVRLAFIPARPGFTWNGPPPANDVDQHVFAKLKTLRVNPSPICTDTVFIRRAYLDLLGFLPTADDARRFVNSDDPAKRAKLIDRLLLRPEFADFWALKWSDLLRNEEKTLDRKGVQNFYAWIRASILHNKPMDQFVRELIASRGSTYKQPASNYYRAMRDPLTRSESTAQLFLGIRLKCAKCHNHPFDRWTQDDYYSWANLFARVDYKILDNRRRDRNDKHEFDGEQIVFMANEGEVDDPRTGTPLSPRFLGAEGDAFHPNEDRLLQLADWITRADNQRFARTMVNRIWYHLMGRGIVDPIDDFRATNPPVNPQLLEALAEDFVAHGFDLRHTIRTMMNSHTYQLSAEPNETNRDDELNFSHAIVRRLTAEQTLDALSQSTGVPIQFNGYPLGIRAGELPGVQAVRLRDEAPSLGDQFLKVFGKPPRLQPCECERTEDTTLSQTFQLVSGPLINRLLTDPHNRLTELLASQGVTGAAPPFSGGASPRAPAEIIEELYWWTLSRPPSEEERRATVSHLSKAADRRSALEDITWALLNSHEFMLRR